MANWKLKRINRDIMNALMSIIDKRVNDPRISLITILSVEAAPDLRTARVFYSIYEKDEQKKEEAKVAFSKATGFLQKELGRNISLKYIPKLNFIYDNSPEHADRIERIFKRLNDEKNTQ